MQYQIEFLDNANTVVRMVHANAGSPAIAFRLVVEKGWPTGALMARIRQLWAARTFRLKASGRGGVDIGARRGLAYGAYPAWRAPHSPLGPATKPQ
jgi:hypothetical protein